MLEAPITAHPENTQVVFGRHCLPWSEAERDKLRPLVGGRIETKTLIGMFPGRTLKAIKKQIARIRDEEGVKRYTARDGGREPISIMLDPEDPGHDDGEEFLWRRAANVSNAAFLRAIARAGMHA